MHRTPRSRWLLDLLRVALRYGVVSLLLLATCARADRRFDARIVNNSPLQDAEPLREYFPETPAGNAVDKIASPDSSERHFGLYLPGPPHYPGPGGPRPPGPWASVTVEVATGTRLTVRPGEAARLHFEVTNLRDAPQHVILSATDTLGLVRIVQPTRVLVPPRGVARATVELFPTGGHVEGLVNTVTMAGQAQDGSTAIRPALIRVSNEKEDEDRWAPHCWFSVPWGQCRNFESTGSACGSAGWNAEVTVRDDLAGLLRVESSPPGNLAPNRYAAGTRAPVTLLMAASCCQETLQLKLWDASGNSRTCEAYVYGLTPAEISSIVLGVILLIALLVLILLACLLCRSRRSKRRHDLPRRPT